MAFPLPSGRRRPALLAAAGVLAATAALPSPASAAGQPFTCEASALRGTVLGGPTLEPIVANRGKPCATTSAGGANLTAPLGPLVKVNLVSAATTLTGPAGRQDQQKASAAGGIADLSIGSLSSLGLALPLDQVPLPPIPPIDVDISPVTGPINAALAAGLPLPPLPVIPGVPVAALPVPGGTPLPTRLTVDISAAVRALLKLPDTPLLDVKGAAAFAAASCSGGQPVLSGSRSVARVAVLGNEVNLDTLDGQPIVDTQKIDPSQIDLSKVTIPAVDGLTGGQLAAVTGLVQTALAAAVKALPPISVPITLAQLQVTPGKQTKTATSLTQTALGLKLSVLGRSVVDLTLGEAKVGAAGVDCAAPTAPTPAFPPPTGAQTSLQCTTRRLVLIDVLQRGSRVAIFGVADKRLVGRSVAIMFQGDGKTAGHATVARDGTFKTTAALPSKALRSSDRARYQAVLGKEKSLNLKLQRRMFVTKLASSSGKVTIAGRVTRPLAAPAQTITLTRRLSCKTSEVVKRFKPRADGTFSVTVAAPKGVAAAVYRLSTKVRKTTRNPKLFSTFTLPRGVDLAQ